MVVVSVTLVVAIAVASAARGADRCALSAAVACSLLEPLREVKGIDNAKVHGAFDEPYLHPSVVWAHQCVMPSLTFFQEGGVVMPKVLGIGSRPANRQKRRTSIAS